VTEVQRRDLERYERSWQDRGGNRRSRMPDGRIQARTHAQADDIDGVTWVGRGTGDGGRETANSSRPGDLIHITLDTVVNDYDFEATLVRRVSSTKAQRSTAKPRALPVMSTVGAFGR
jgi:hypothetical protein